MSEVQTRRSELSKAYALKHNKEVHRVTCSTEIDETGKPSLRGTYKNTAINFAQRMRDEEADTSERCMPFQEKKRACHQNIRTQGRIQKVLRWSTICTEGFNSVWSSPGDSSVKLRQPPQDYENDMSESLISVRYSVSAIGHSTSYTFTKRKEGNGFPWTTVLCAI